MQYMEYIKSLLMCFEDLAVLELRDDTRNQPPENEWFDESLCRFLRNMRPSLGLVVSPSKVAFEYQTTGWTPVPAPAFAENPFHLAGFRPFAGPIS